MKAVQLPDSVLQADRTHAFSHTFRQASSDGGFTLAAASGTIAALSERGGGVSLTTNAADNAVGSILSDGKYAVLAEAKPIFFKAVVQFAEAASNAANVYVGLTSSAAAAVLGDNGAGPAADYSGIGFFKADGALNWSIELSVGTTQITRELNADVSLDGLVKVAGSSAYQTLEIHVMPKTSAKADVIFYIDGVAVYKATDWTYTSIAAMGPAAVVKAGTSAAQAMKVRRFDFAQVI